MDILSSKEFQYSEGQAARGVFDWKFIFKSLPKPTDIGPEEPSDNPIMLGFGFAIYRQFFWDLGGYDENLQIWNGENYELSFKVWLCGGSIQEIPCSRVGHLFRSNNPTRTFPGIDYVGRNFKRVAEVWLDEYKEYLYKRDRKRYSIIDPGDLTKQKAIRKQLNCKPFKYFLENVAPDLTQTFPLDNMPSFASGAIYSEIAPKLCLDAGNLQSFKKIQIRSCYPNKVNPIRPQFWNLTWHRNIIIYSSESCLDSSNLDLYPCHNQIGNTQTWKYDLNTHQLINGVVYKRCLSINLDAASIYLEECSSDNPKQKWKWGYVNETALQNWCASGVKYEFECKIKRSI